MKKHIIILAGGPSSEHEVSLKTADEIIKNLDPRKYLAHKIVVTKNGQWLMPQSAAGLVSNSPRDLILSEKQALGSIKNKNISVVFIAMHGEYGEDGKIQGLLDIAGIPYTGSGVLASALGMDKARSASILRDAGFFVPDFLELNDAITSVNDVFKKIKFPLVVKPSDRGSSVGVGIVRNKRDFATAVKKAKKFSKRVMVQRFIDGREITCGVLERVGKLIALPPVEIKPMADKFYDYKSKYQEGGSEHVIPPKASPSLLNLIKNQALLAHKIIGCSGMSRSDFILDKNNKPYFLEINTIPGMTKTSLLPESARAAGISFPRVLDLIIRSSFKNKT